MFEQLSFFCHHDRFLDSVGWVDKDVVVVRIHHPKRDIIPVVPLIGGFGIRGTFIFDLKFESLGEFLREGTDVGRMSNGIPFLGELPDFFRLCSFENCALIVAERASFAVWFWGSTMVPSQSVRGGAKFRIPADFHYGEVIWVFLVLDDNVPTGPSFSPVGVWNRFHLDDVGGWNVADIK